MDTLKEVVFWIAARPPRQFGARSYGSCGKDMSDPGSFLLSRLMGWPPRCSPGMGIEPKKWPSSKRIARGATRTASSRASGGVCESALRGCAAMAILP